MKSFKYIPPLQVLSSELKSKYWLFNSCILLTILTGFGVIINDLIFNFNSNFPYAVAVTFAFSILYVLFTKHVITLVASANIYISLGTLFVIISSYMSGGFQSPVLFWTGLIPLYALWLLNRKYAWLWFLISILLPLVFLLFANHSYSLPLKEKYDFYIGNHIYWAFFVMVLLTVNIYLVGLDFETKKRKAIYEMNNANAELRKTLEQLEVAEKELQTAQKHKDTFIAQVSHEMRTPMTTIFGITNVLKKELDTHKEDVEALLQSSKQLLYIIDDLLDVVKIKTGKFHYEKLPFDLQALLCSINKSNELKAKEKKLSFNFEASPNLPKIIMGDPFRLSQILNNIVGNAIKFTNSGCVMFTANYKNEIEKLQFLIEDTGIGMNKDEQKRVFDVFSQANADIHLIYGGTGMGLSITKQLVELFGGTICIQSSSGKGTIIEVELPFEKSTDFMVQDNVHKVSQYEKRLITERAILLAEDNQINQRILKKILENELPGIKIDTASDGDEVLAKAKVGKYDVILMDVQMPKKDGLETTKIIKSNEQKEVHKTRIIALTSYARKTEAEKCLEAGMDDYISKPFNHEELLYKIYSQIFK